ncbi:hypothetical protein J3E69DRAFT_357267 [Trichoderma sp. SZMC 28015]
MYILCLSSAACQRGKACSGDAASEEEKKSVNVGKVIQWTERATAQHLNGAGPDGFVSKKKPAPSPKQRTTSCCDAAKRDPCSANSQAAKQLKRGCWCRMDGLGGATRSAVGRQKTLWLGV